MLYRRAMAPDDAPIDDPRMRAGFEAEGNALTRRAVRTVCAVGVPLVLGFALFDYLRYPEIFA